MSEFSNNIKNSLSKKVIINNISSLQNNYYKEDKILGKNRSNNYLSTANNKAKGHSSSKNKYKVTYSNSILKQNESKNYNKNIENRNVVNIININNKNTNSSIGNIKEINFYNNGYKNQTNTSYSFYDKIVGKIILNNNSYDTNNTSNKIKEMKINNIDDKLLFITSNKNKNINYNYETNISRKNKKRGPKSIYANKRPSMPLNKNNNKKINNLNLNLNINNINNIKKEEKSFSNKKKLSSLSKLSFTQNKNNLINSTNNYNTYNNISYKKNTNKNNLIPIALKHKYLSIKKPFKQEIKKCQSQSYFKKYKINNEFNTSYNVNQKIKVIMN